MERRFKHLFFILIATICFPEGKRCSFIPCLNAVIIVLHSSCVHLMRFVEPYGDAAH